jgi:hypothetical protein
MAWLDPQGQIAGFDASDMTDGGFRRVAEGLLVYSRPIGPIAGRDLPGRLLDDSGPFFERLGEGSGWQTAGGAEGVGRAFAWTANTKAVRAQVFGQWTVHYGTSGSYRVYAHVPASHATTRRAHYEVYHMGQTAQIVVDQQAAQGSWVLLGEFEFAGDGAEYVRLSNLTGESRGSTEVAFDAISLVKNG